MHRLRHPNQGYHFIREPCPGKSWAKAFGKKSIHLCQPAQFILADLVNSLTLALTIMKAIADDKVNVAHKKITLLEYGENIMGKGENAGNQHFLLFSQCFQKPSLIGSLKVGIVW